MFQIKATPAGAGRSSVSAAVNIELTDINDNSPEFAETTLEFTVDEESPVDTHIGQLLVSVVVPLEGVLGECETA